MFTDAKNDYIVIRPVSVPCWRPLPETQQPPQPAPTTAAPTRPAPASILTQSVCGNSQYAHWCGTGKGAVPLKGGRRIFQTSSPRSSPLSAAPVDAENRPRPTTPRQTAIALPSCGIVPGQSAALSDTPIHTGRGRGGMTPRQNESSSHYYGAGMVPQGPVASKSNMTSVAMSTKLRFLSGNIRVV